MRDPNERRYCRARGLHGKHKKRFRKAVRERAKQRASATDALPSRPSTDDLFNLGHGLGARNA